jgi:ATP-dependent RNA helicase DHX37/DHR1
VSDQHRHYEELMKEVELEDDEETLSLKNFNRDLKEINFIDKKPVMRQIPRLEADLPVKMHEREILESVEDNIVTVVCGETGSGKST